MQMDNSQKMQFFKGLPTVLSLFPRRTLLMKVMPSLSSEFNTAELVPFILPSIFYISEQVSDSEFANKVLPFLIPVFQMQRPYQVMIIKGYLAITRLTFTVETYRVTLLNVLSDVNNYYV